jgi:hypothetical protein
MSWAIIPEFRLPDEPEALTYIAAVEAADGQALEPAVKLAINAFIKGCKADGIWPAIKASCILAGARTRLGALTPLVGPTPTSFNFVDADYNRKTGLAGDASAKHLVANRAPSEQPQNNIHVCAYATNTGTTGYGAGVGTTSTNAINLGLPSPLWRFNSTQYQPANTTVNAGFVGMSRIVSTEFILRRNQSNETAGTSSNSPSSASIRVFDRGNSPTDARLAFYSIGESLDLALLDARVTDLINAFDAAI